VEATAWYTAFLMRREELEIHVPISPTPNFLNRVHYLAASLELHGGRFAHAPIVVTVGDDREPFDIEDYLGWPTRYNIEWRWLPRSEYLRDTFYATALKRFTYDFSARHVLMLDADVIVRGRIDELIDAVERDQAFYGMTALASPWHSLWNERSHEEWWQLVFDEADLGPVPYVSQHSCWGVLWGKETPRMSPPYFNLGVLAAPADLMSSIGNVILENMRSVERVREFIYKVQIALTLAVVKTKTPWKELSMRFNMANHPVIAAAYPAEADAARIMHYLCGDVQDFQKNIDMESVESVDTWLARPFAGAGEIERQLRECFQAVHPRVMREAVHAAGLSRVVPV